MLKISVESYAEVLLDVARDYNVKIGKKALLEMINEECSKGNISEIFVYKFLKALKAKAQENGLDMSKEEFEKLKSELVKIGANLIRENERKSVQDKSEKINMQGNKTPKYSQIPNQEHEKTYYPKNKRQQEIMQNSIKNKARPKRRLKRKLKLALATALGIAGIAGGAMSLSNKNVDINQTQNIQETESEESNLENKNSVRANYEKESISINENDIIKTNNIENLSYTDDVKDQEENKLFNMIVEEYNQMYPEDKITVDDLGIVYSISSNRIYYEDGKYILNYNLDRNEHPNAKIISAEIPTYIVLNNKTMSPISAVARLSSEHGLKETNIDVEQYILNYSDTGIYLKNGKTVDLIMENPKNIEEIDKYNEQIYKLYEEQCKDRQETLENIEKQERQEKLNLQNDIKLADEER